MNEKGPPAASASRWSRLFEPVDIASLVFFRVAFGALLVWEVIRYFDHGWIKRYYIEPAFHFTYYGFGWVQPWPGNGMVYHFVVLGVLAACILAGFAYRVATTLFFLAFTYVFLLDQTRYLNHFYLVSLVSFLLIFVPAHRAFSLDVWRNPRLRSQTAPRWALWLLRTQFAWVYVFGGIAKLNGDWIRGEPLRMWLANRAQLPLIGPLLTKEWAVLFFVYGGLLFDLLVIPLILWPRTRMLAFALAAIFHVLNAKLFQIGIFPWMALAGTLLFLPPEWPRRIGALVSGRRPARLTVPRGAPHPRTSKPVAVLLGTFLLLQVVLPLRHWLYPGNVHWTEEGHRFSWRMKLRTKRGEARFYALDRATGQQREIEPAGYLRSAQVRSMATHPDMVLQFAHFLVGELQRQGWRAVEIRAQVAASLNGRDRQSLIDPRVNLAAQKRNLLPASWIVPLTEPLPQRGSTVPPASSIPVSED